MGRAFLSEGAGSCATQAESPPPEKDSGSPQGSGDPRMAKKRAPSRTGVFRAFQHRNFRLFASGQMISLIGTWMQSVAQAWLVYRLTGSAVQLGLLGFASQIPIFLIAPLGGLAADRFERRRILYWTQGASLVLAGILAALTLTRQIHLWHLYVLATMLGITNAFDIPARQAFLVQLVGREDLPNAIGLNSSMFNGARLLGPAIAGVLVDRFGEGWCFFGNSVSYVAVLAGLVAMRLPSGPAVAREGDLLAHLREGFRFVVHTPPIRALLLLLGVMSVMGSPYSVLMPLFADRILGGGPHTLGLLMSAAGAGALMGALLLASREDLDGLGTFVPAACAGFGLALVAFSQSRLLGLSIGLLVPVGFCMMVQMASSNTLVQAMVPDRLRGRVMAVYSMVFMGLSPVGALLSGTLARSLGAPLTVALGGLACAAGAAVFAHHLSGFHREARALVEAQEAADQR